MADDDQLSGCPIPLTHRRLRHAHMLWHQALESYQEPERFRANLNATIEALRNVTFVLQKEKAAFTDFDGWYGLWQKRLRNDNVAKWLHDARVTVVHQGDLDSYSYAEVRLVDYRDEVLSSAQVPIAAPLELILQNPALLPLGNPARALPLPENTCLAIERRWSTKDLEGKEILSALAHVYGLVAHIVLDAHAHLGNLNCISSDAQHLDFPSEYDRTGMLRCMVASAESRTQRLDHSTMRSLIPTAESLPANIDRDALPFRYGLEDGDRISEIDRLDPLALAKKVQHIAKRTLRRDKSHARMMFIRDGRAQWHQIVLSARDQPEKRILMQMAAQFVESRGCDAIVEVAEVWTAKLSPESLRYVGNLENLSGREEALAVTVATREGLLREYLTPILRGRFGGIKLGDTTEADKPSLNYLIPIIDVWRRQRVVQTADGTRYRVWEPDALDFCPCGSDMRYGVCCGPLLADGFETIGVENEVERAISDGNVELAEKTARAAVAKYITWIKQHTAPTMHVAQGLHEKVLSIDILALESHVDVMIRALSSAGKSELILPHLQRLRRMVAIPQIAVRLAAIASRWLFEVGRPEEAVLELSALGNVTELKDTLALSIVARHFDLTKKERETVLRKAIDVATCDEEKQMAQLNAASHLLTEGHTRDALSLVQSVIDSAGEDETSPMRSAALIFRWRLTGGEEDFKTALIEMTSDDLPAHMYRNAVYLIDMGKYTEAENLLLALVNAGDVEAKLLIADARMRSGAYKSAEALLDTIKDNEVSAVLQFPYAHTVSLLVLVGGIETQRQHAVALLEALPPTGGAQDEHVKSLLLSLKTPE
jgi:hypothetical protein